MLVTGNFSVDLAAPGPWLKGPGPPTDLGQRVPCTDSTKMHQEGSWQDVPGSSIYNKPKPQTLNAPGYAGRRAFVLEVWRVLFLHGSAC